jgi:hypothetical protein
MSFKNEVIHRTKYYAVGGVGTGDSPSDPAAMAAGDVYAIPEGAVITGVSVIVTTAVTGSTPQIQIGDDDSAQGFVADANVTEGTVGAYAGAGTYIASGAQKYYSATGKEVKFAIGGSIAAGAFAVVVRGFRI